MRVKRWPKARKTTRTRPKAKSGLCSKPGPFRSMICQRFLLARCAARRGKWWRHEAGRFCQDRYSECVPRRWALTSRVAVITGASRGIGAATALVLAERGLRVVVNYRSSAEEAEEVVRAVSAAGGEAVAIRADVHRGRRGRLSGGRNRAAVGPGRAAVPRRSRPPNKAHSPCKRSTSPMSGAASTKN